VAVSSESGLWLALDKSFSLDHGYFGTLASSPSDWVLHARQLDSDLAQRRYPMAHTVPNPFIAGSTTSFVTMAPLAQALARLSSHTVRSLRLRSGVGFMLATVNPLTPSALTKPSTQKPKVSIIIPLFNEEESVDPLVDALWTVLADANFTFEVLLINDGSRDDTLGKLRSAALRKSHARIIDFRRNYGQTAAIMAGIDYARGEIIISLDADLQNDPKDIPCLMAKLEEGYDVVSGWRRDRQDAPIRRNLLSRFANRLISTISGLKLHDYGCTLKAYRADVIKDVRLYGEMHRFIPIYASWMGARVTEIAVRHHSREFGESKYGLGRVFKVILDLLVVKFLDRHLVKPIYVFGGFGLISFAISVISCLWMLYLKIFEHVPMILTPLPLLTVLAFLIGFISLLMGLIAEMLVRTYFESQGRAAYNVRALINFENE
jgi:glycosyltransferase involved in cell wall biosynthesis